MGNLMGHETCPALILLELRDRWDSTRVVYATEGCCVRAVIEKAAREGANLARANLRNANLTRANLRGANLTDANLTGADLTGAHLTYANLEGADLRNVNLTGANLTGADLTGANLEGANLRGANLTRANLTDANLTRANLRGANLNYANLEGANLTYANLEGADLARADLARANLHGANLHGADLEGANLARARGLTTIKGHSKFIGTGMHWIADQEGPIRLYKLTTAEGRGPFYAGLTYKVGETVEIPEPDLDAGIDCGAGVNVATLDWCLKNWKTGYRIFVVEFRREDVAAIPWTSDGKIRLKRCKVVAEKTLAEMGLAELGLA